MASVKDFIIENLEEGAIENEEVLDEMVSDTVLDSLKGNIDKSMEQIKSRDVLGQIKGVKDPSVKAEARQIDASLGDIKKRYANAKKMMQSDNPKQRMRAKQELSSVKSDVGKTLNKARNLARKAASASSQQKTVDSKAKGKAFKERVQKKVEVKRKERVGKAKGYAKKAKDKLADFTS